VLVLSQCLSIGGQLLLREIQLISDGSKVGAVNVSFGINDVRRFWVAIYLALKFAIVAGIRMWQEAVICRVCEVLVWVI
jgi:hypothetical protein